MYRAVLIIILCYCASGAYAQSAYSIKGRVTATDSVPIAFSTILLNRLSDSSLFKATITDNNGKFEFRDLPKINFFITISALGYEPSGTEALYLKDAVTYTGNIAIKRDARSLKEIMVSAKRPFIETKPGKTVLNISESIISAGNNALDILKKAPGVQADENDIIRLNGKQGALIMIDGKSSYLTGADLTNLLLTIHSTSIDQIELISSPGSNYDAGGGAGIINIKLSKDKRLGRNGTIGLTAGASRLDGSQHINSRYVPVLTFNNSGKKINVFGNYSYTDLTLGKKSILDRSIPSASGPSNIAVNYFSNTARYNHTYRIGADYLASPFHTLGIVLNGSSAAITINKANTTNISSSGNPEADISTNSIQDRHISNIGVNLNYKGIFGKNKNELSADADYSAFNRRSIELLMVSNVPFKMKMSPVHTVLQNTSPADYDIKAVKADYVIPLSGSAKLSVGAKSSHVSSHSSLDFGRLEATIYYPDAMFTNDFHFAESINSMYGNYSRTYQKGNLQVGLRAEYTSSKGMSGIELFSKKYLNIFPNLAITSDIDKNNRLFFSYSRRIDRPAYEDLNPFVAYLDQYNYRSGNPTLSPQYSNNLEATHTWLKKYSTTIRYSITNNAFSTVFKQDDKTRTVTQVRVNLDKMYAYGLVLNAPVNPAKWWSANVNISAMNIRYRSTSAGGSLNNGRPDITIKALQNFSLPAGISAELSSKYQSPSFYGILNYKHIYNMDLGLSRAFFNKKASVRISATDILNGDINNFYSRYQNLDLKGYEKAETRSILLNLSWQFGKAGISPSKKRSSDTEQNRVGNL